MLGVYIYIYLGYRYGKCSIVHTAICGTVSLLRKLRCGGALLPLVENCLMLSPVPLYQKHFLSKSYLWVWTRLLLYASIPLKVVIENISYSIR